VNTFPYSTSKATRNTTSLPLVEGKMRGQFDLEGAIWQRNSTREYCQR
jgi:hypothetical protein